MKPALRATLVAHTNNMLDDTDHAARACHGVCPLPIGRLQVSLRATPRYKLAWRRCTLGLELVCEPFTWGGARGLWSHTCGVAEAVAVHARITALLEPDNRPPHAVVGLPDHVRWHERALSPLNSSRDPGEASFFACMLMKKWEANNSNASAYAVMLAESNVFSLIDTTMLPQLPLMLWYNACARAVAEWTALVACDDTMSAALRVRGLPLQIARGWLIPDTDSADVHELLN